MLNLTQHNATPEQVAEGVVNPSAGLQVALLTFEGLPSAAEVQARAEALAEVASAEGATSAMIGGAPYLMGPLVAALKAKGISPYFAFSNRISEEVLQPDGTVRKVQIFRHAGWVAG
jgi:hypothetical protein